MSENPNRKRNKTKGLVVVFTGNGKGKTSAAMGILTRAHGHGFRVGVIQFIKSPDRVYGESVTAHEMGIPFQSMGNGFVFDQSNKTEDCKTAQIAWAEAKSWICSGNYDILILDEITYLFAYGWLDVQEVIEWLKQNKPADMHLIMTGRNAPDELIEYADMVTEMREIKHPFREQDLPAQRGVDY